MNVLALLPYPRAAAAARFRIFQMVEPLARRGITMDVRPAMTDTEFASLYVPGRSRRTAMTVARGVARRVADLGRTRHADVVFVQREALVAGPPVFEALLRRPLVLDLDDAAWVAYDSPTYGVAGRVLKWPGKVDALIRRARVVTCGSEAIAEHVRSAGTTACLVPTVVDTDVFRPRDEQHDGPPLVGWIGTHSTVPYLRSIEPALADVARNHAYRLLVVATGTERFDVPGAEVECRAWELDREVDDFRSLDVGLYPITDDEWARGKSAFKSVQYMAVGVPFVASPVGAAATVGEPGRTHFVAARHDEWVSAVTRLVTDAALRRTMGAAGRAQAVERYHVEGVADRLAAALELAATG